MKFNISSYSFFYFERPVSYFFSRCITFMYKFNNFHRDNKHFLLPKLTSNIFQIFFRSIAINSAINIDADFIGKIDHEEERSRGRVIFFMQEGRRDRTIGEKGETSKQRRPEGGSVRPPPSIFGKGMTLIPTRKRLRGSFIHRASHILHQSVSRLDKTRLDLQILYANVFLRNL